MIKLEPQITEDGSYTFFSEEFQEHFHSHAGAKREAQEKFLIPCRIADQAATQSTIRLLDICYGLGHNTAAALTEIWRVNPDCQVELFALERDQAIATHSYQQNLLNPWSENVSEILGKLSQNLQIQTDRLKANLLIGDARQTIQTVMQQNFQADAIFLDPFSPPKCPQLWTVEFIDLVAKCLDQKGYLATYSCAAAVRFAMQQASLKVASTPAVGRRSPGTLARWIPEDLEALSPQEQEHLHTNAAIPYRDPELNDDRETILARRKQEQSVSSLESTSQWKKRWL